MPDDIQPARWQLESMKTPALDRCFAVARKRLDLRDAILVALCTLVPGNLAVLALVGAGWMEGVLVDPAYPMGWVFLAALGAGLVRMLCFHAGDTRVARNLDAWTPGSKDRFRTALALRRLSNSDHPALREVENFCGTCQKSLPLGIPPALAAGALGTSMALALAAATFPWFRDGLHEQNQEAFRLLAKAEQRLGEASDSGEGTSAEKSPIELEKLRSRLETTKAEILAGKFRHPADRAAAVHHEIAAVLGAETFPGTSPLTPNGIEPLAGDQLFAALASKTGRSPDSASENLADAIREQRFEDALEIARQLPPHEAGELVAHALRDSGRPELAARIDEQSSPHAILQQWIQDLAGSPSFAEATPHARMDAGRTSGLGMEETRGTMAEAQTNGGVPVSVPAGDFSPSRAPSDPLAIPDSGESPSPRIEGGVGLGLPTVAGPALPGGPGAAPADPAFLESSTTANWIFERGALPPSHFPGGDWIPPRARQTVQNYFLSAPHEMEASRESR